MSYTPLANEHPVTPFNTGPFSAQAAFGRANLRSIDPVAQTVTLDLTYLDTNGNIINFQAPSETLSIAGNANFIALEQQMSGAALTQAGTPPTS